MSSTTTAGLREHVGEYVGAFVGAPVRPQTYLNLLYLLLAFPLGLAYFAFVTAGVSLGVGLAVVLVGVPILAVTVAASLALASLERALANYLLDARVDERALPADASLREGLRAIATDLETYKAVVYLPSKLAFGTLAVTLSTSVLATGVSMLLVPLYYDEPGLYVGVVTDRPVELHPTLYVAWNKLLVGFEAVWTLSAWRVSTLGDALVVAAAGALLLLVGLYVLNALARVSRWYARFMLDDGYDLVATLRDR